MRTNSKKKIDNNVSYIEQKLNRIPLEKLSKESEFSKRKPKKIKAKDFLLGFFLMASNRESHSYQNWAIKIGWLIKDRVSKQALWKKMHQGQINFLKKTLSTIMQESLNWKRNNQITEKLKKFKNVIIEDSTSIKLADKLHEEYPGNGYWDKRSKKAILKLQSSYSITRRNFIRLDITSFRENDQGYSHKIVQIAKRGDLIIRDLGYFVLKVFQKLNNEGIYFISRLKKRVSVFSRKDETVIDLAKMLKKRGNLDIEVFIGAKEKLPIRLIALPVEEAVANERRRKAKANRDKRCHPSREHLYLLGWELFITNVDKDKLSTDEIAQLYFIRWRIETIFKTWKSCFKIIAIPREANKIRVESYIYCMLIFIILFQVHFYNYLLAKTKTDSFTITTREISLFRLMQFITRNIEFVLLSLLRDRNQSEEFIFKQINYYCLYESRRDRVNFDQKLLKLS
ncbi:MAG: IS4 family transposase [Bacteroidetes bacterium]|nr:IS4 family transposase [Bacteroidota bacterium]